MKKNIVKRIILSVVCCLLSCCFIGATISATETTVDGIYCYTDRAANFLTFSAATIPNDNFGGTYKLVSTGTYATTLGLTQNKTYTVTGASYAKILNKVLPASTATRWTKVSSTHYYKGTADNDDFIQKASTYD